MSIQHQPFMRTITKSTIATSHAPLAYCAAGLFAIAMNTFTAVESMAATLPEPTSAPASTHSGKSKNASVAVDRGRYLVKAMGCADCHTPLKMGVNGPEQDLSRGLSGHPQDFSLLPAPSAQGPWLWGGAATNTAFWGPWGVSFAANLTSDKTTGIGAWTDSMFIKAMRSGKQMGAGRPLLPPMPWPAIGQLNDQDLRAMLAYLKSEQPIQNKVPSHIAPLASTSAASSVAPGH
jgi:hypothetical protein